MAGSCCSPLQVDLTSTADGAAWGQAPTAPGLQVVVLCASVFYEFHLQFTYSVILFHEFQYFRNVEIAWRFFLGAPSCFLKHFKVLSVDENCFK